MSKAPTYTKWPPGAWTPLRCAVWQELMKSDHEALKAFEKWVDAESRSGSIYPAELLPEHQALLGGKHDQA